MPLSLMPCATTPAFRLDHQGPVARITIDCPAKHNALNHAAWVALGETITALGDRMETRVIVIGATGETAFCSGADISEFEAAFATSASAAHYGGAIARTLQGIASSAKPVIAEIDGACVGGGCALAMACDLRFASTRSRFAVTPVKIGAAYSYDDTRRLVSLVGPGRAKEILFFAEFLPAEEALSAGLVNRVLTPEALPAFVAERAAKLSRLSRTALRVAKRVVNAIAAHEPHATPEIAGEIGSIFASADFREGYSAFLEKRSPAFL